MVGKILIVDSVATNRIVFKVAFSEAFYSPVLANDGDSCLRLAVQERPDLILLDLALPDISGLSLITQLRASPATHDVPILALVSKQDAILRQQAFLAGVDDVLPKHGALQPMLARVRNLLRGREGLEGLGAHGAGLDLIGLSEATPPFSGQAVISILATQSQGAIDRHRTVSNAISDRVILQSRENALSEPNIGSHQPAPDVFVIEATVAGMADSLRLMSELRSRAATRHSAICIVQASRSDEAAMMAYDQGADDLVEGGIAPEEMALRLRALIRRKRRDDQLRASVQDGLRMAMIDPLTGLHNRRYALPQLVTIAERALTDNTCFAVMVIDLDRFKLVNDRFGHACGDAVLVEVAQRLQANLRAADLLARIGGEEFLVALPDTSFEEARMAADRLCRAIEAPQIQVGPLTKLKVTISIGLAVSAGLQQPEPIAATIDRADRALLRAKSEGRNKVTISQNAA